MSPEARDTLNALIAELIILVGLAAFLAGYVLYAGH